jgi:phosphate starvation-inducible PhoH-like protein
VEAGEALGFLPGDLQEKIFPYLRPLYDALYDMLEPEEIQRYMDRGVIEIAPLAYMRGRTLNHAFVILDEAQNTTTEQMFMFLTRLGSDSRCVVTGDQTQIDLPPRKTSGLVEATEVLGRVPGINFTRFSERDVVRHPLVQSIIHAYRLYRDEPTGANKG